MTRIMMIGGALGGASLLGGVAVVFMLGAAPADTSAPADAATELVTGDPRVLDGSDIPFGEGLVTRMIVGLANDGIADPGSAQFHTLVRVSPNMADQDFVCGFVNLRNRTGEYVGFVPFVHAMESGTMRPRIPDERGQTFIADFALGMAGCDDVLGVDLDA